MKKRVIGFLLLFIVNSLIIFSKPHSKGDIEITKLMVNVMKSNKKIKAIILIQNIGNSRIDTPFNIVLYYRRYIKEKWNKIKEWRFKGISLNGRKELSYIMDFIKSNKLYFRAVADPENKINEESEENNDYEILFKPQENELKTYMPLPAMEITVSAPRLEIPLKENPAATTVVEKDVLNNMPRAIAADEALLLVPGVRVENQADGERVHLYIRGQGILSERGIRGIKVILDGIPLNDPTGFVSDLYDIDWMAVKRIEVLRGPYASLFGCGSSGGIINIVTEDGSKKPYKIKGSFTLGSYAFKKSFLNLGGTQGKTNYRISLSENQGNGYREHTKFRANNLYGKFHWEINSSINLSAIISWTDFYNDNAEGLNLEWLRENRRMANPDSLIYNEYQRTKRVMSGIVGKVKLSENQGLNFTLYYKNTVYDESVPSSVDHRLYDNTGSIFQYYIDTGREQFKNHLTIGSDMELQTVDEHKHPNLGNAEEGSEFLSNQTIFQKGIGVYLIDRFELNSSWSIVLNVRYDNIYNELKDKLKANTIDLSGDAKFGKTTERIGIAWNPEKGFGLYANVGTGFIPPSTEELANNPDSLGGLNTHLKSAVSYGGELGTRGYIGDSLYYDLNFYYLHTDNDFSRYRISSRPLETFYRNIGSTKRYGIESFLGWYPTEDLNIRLAYTHSDFKYLLFETDNQFISGTYLPNIPKHRAVLSLIYNHEKLGFNIVSIAQTKSYIDISNDVWTNGYFLLNARLSYKIGANIELSVNGQNLLNTKYIGFTEPDPDGNSYQPAPGREVFVSLKFGL